MKNPNSMIASFQQRRWVLLSLALFILVSNAFQLSMVASRTPFGNSFDPKSLGSRAQSSYSKQSSSPSITSGVISNLAVIALRLRLQEHTHVSCDVNASSSNVLLRGSVGPVTVKGRGWKSRLGLTCRAIEATVDSCELDVGRILSNQKLVLTTPAKGRAMVALNAIDFGNFITHPLMKPPSLPKIDGSESGSNLTFLKDDVTIDPVLGIVQFYGIFLDTKWKFTLQRGDGGQKARITAIPASKPDHSKLDYDFIASELTIVTSNFFNEMVFELDGTYLTFGDMMVTSKGKEPSAMLSLGITVRKFPSPGLEF